MPNATYTLGFTVVPDWPTCRACGIQPGQQQGAATGNLQQGVLPPGTYDLYAVLDQVTLTASMTIQ